ncbi:MAG: hypothetical protein J6M39_05385 [Lachnospiraceae bacterium]|nr:hypothetical protein [Lachnospiraceae bacterium]
MIKKILSIIMICSSMIYLCSCGSSTGNSGLSSQIKKAKAITSYNDTATIEEVDLVTFGMGEKNNPIEWVVLEKKNGMALLLSKDLVDSREYDGKLKDEKNWGSPLRDITWEMSAIREWLNKDFIDTAFSKSEQEIINNTKVETNDNIEYGTSGGNDTTDKLFLLSVEELNKYFKTSRLARFKNNRIWWLRTPGATQNKVAVVDLGGDVEYGRDVCWTSNNMGVRPALWVKY